MTTTDTSMVLKTIKAVIAGCAIAMIGANCAAAYAADTDPGTSTIASNLQLSGFLSLVGGSAFNGSLSPNYAANNGPTQLNNITCPCYVADWANGGVYGNSFSLQPESRVGVQAQYNFTPDLHFVGQVVVRGEDTNPNVQWAYFSYKIDEHLEAHIGRQRLPLYYYSLFQDVGFAYPWVNVPPELYGWEVTNYDGASVRYNNSFGDTNVTSSVFGGQEVLGHSLFYGMFQKGDTDVSWKHIVGVDTEVNHGPLTVRAVYIQSSKGESDNQISSYSEGDQKFYGVAVNLDFDSWFVLSELTEQKVSYGSAVPAYTTTSPASTIGAGLRLGKWTPFVNYSLFTQHTSDEVDYPPSSFKRAALVLRYDIDANSDVKAQIDRNWDTTGNFGGNVDVFRIAYDRVF